MTKEWVEHIFRNALAGGYGYVPREVQDAKDFIENLPDRDRAVIEFWCGPDRETRDLTPEILQSLKDKRLSKITERYAKQHGGIGLE